MIVRACATLGGVLLVALMSVAEWQPSHASGQGKPAAPSPSGWQLPPDAAETKNPLTGAVTDRTPIRTPTTWI
jgi:hypothetical protein